MVPATASAGVASVFPSWTDGSTTFMYGAYLGEHNAVTVTESVNSQTAERTVTFADAGATIVAGSGCANLSANEVACSTIYSEGVVAFLKFDVSLVDLDDSVVIRTVQDGSTRVGRLDGGPGNDLLSGGSEDDALWGGSGADLLLGGDGYDVISYRERVNPVTVTLDRLPNDGETGEFDDVRGVESLEGGAGNDLLSGDWAVNRLSGRGGNDTIRGGDGMDTIGGGRGNDRLYGGDGEDEIRGGLGNDLVIGGRRSDSLSGGGGSDRLFGGSDNDSIRGEWGDDVIAGGTGRDNAYGNLGRDVFWMRDGGRDWIVDGGRGADRARIDRALDPVSGVEKLF